MIFELFLFKFLIKNLSIKEAEIENIIILEKKIFKFFFSKVYLA